MKGIVIFTIVFIFFTGGAVLSLLYSKKKNYIKKTRYSEKWSETTKNTINWIIRILAVILSLVLLIYVTIPMAIDIPNLISGKYNEYEGEVTSYKFNNNYKGNILCKRTIMVNNKEKFTYYFGDPVEKGQHVTVVYLPNSRFVLDILE